MTVYFISIPNLCISSTKDYTNISESDTMEFLNPILQELNIPLDKFKYHGGISYDFQMVQVLTELKNEVRMYAEALDPKFIERFKRVDVEKYMNHFSYEVLAQIEFAETVELYDSGEAEVLDWK